MSDLLTVGALQTPPAFTRTLVTSVVASFVGRRKRTRRNRPRQVATHIRRRPMAPLVTRLPAPATDRERIMDSESIARSVGIHQGPREGG